MPDILFKCPTCQKALAVDGDMAKAEVKCVDCLEMIVVPVPHFNFLCSSCKTVLSSAREFRGQEFTCTECNAKITVPLIQRPKYRETEAPAVRPEPPPTQKDVAPEVVSGGRHPSIKDEEAYARMVDNMGRRADSLKCKRTPRWKKILVQFGFLASFLGVLYFVIGLFVDAQVVKTIIFCVISVVLLLGLVKFCLTSSIYD